MLIKTVGDGKNSNNCLIYAGGEYLAGDAPIDDGAVMPWRRGGRPVFREFNNLVVLHACSLYSVLCPDLAKMMSTSQ